MKMVKLKYCRVTSRAKKAEEGKAYSHVNKTAEIKQQQIKAGAKLFFKN